MRERFILDKQQNTLFINFAGLRIESRAQVDAMEQFVCEAYEEQGHRIYAVVNYEGTEIAPEVIEYYGERIKELHDRYGLVTVRYSSSGFTRSVLRYLGAVSDLESNTFATRAEALRAIQEIEARSRADGSHSFRALLNPAQSVLGALMFTWLAALFALMTFHYFSPNASVITAIPVLLLAALVTACLVYFKALKPMRQTEGFVRRMAAGGAGEPLDISGQDEAGHLALALNETASQLRRDIERLSGLYHISLLMGTGTEVSRVGELLTRKIARLLQAEMCVLLFYDESEVTAQLPGYGVSDEQLRLLRSSTEEKSIAAHVVKTGEPYLTNDAANDPLVSHAAAELLGARELLAVPLQAGERIFGVLEVMNKSGGFLEEDKQLVTIFASQAAQLLANVHLLEKERRLARQLIASERLAAVGELVAGVAHEVRNPLFGITATISALSRKLEDRAAVRPFLDVINTEVGRLNHLMEQLLEHSRPIKPDTEAADLRAVIHEAMAEFKTQAEAKNVTLICDCAAAIPKLHFDRRKMHGVFVNLLDNALHHIGDHGQVRIAVSEHGNTLPKTEDRRMRIEVSDTGCGIATENVEKVFEPFFTTRSGGTGLGLAITRKTIHDHGGTITVKSEANSGCSFIITLPLEKQ